MIDPQKINEDGMYELILAIVRQAMHDYEFSLRGKKQMTQDRRAYTPEEMERWFLSEYGELLCAGRGQQVIDLCRKNVATQYGADCRSGRHLQHYKKKDGENHVKITLELDCRVEQIQTKKDELARYLESLGTKVLKVREVLPEHGGEK